MVATNDQILEVTCLEVDLVEVIMQVALAQEHAKAMLHVVHAHQNQMHHAVRLIELDIVAQHELEIRETQVLHVVLLQDVVMTMRLEHEVRVELKPHPLELKLTQELA